MSKPDKTLKILVGPWAGEGPPNKKKPTCRQILRKQGCTPDEDSVFATKEMTRSDLLDLASRLLDSDVGVMIRPATIKRGNIDYIVFVDTKEGRFSRR